MNNTILVISAGIVHPNPRCRFNMRLLLKENRTYSCTFTSNLDSLLDLAKEKPSIVVLYFQKKNISDSLLDSMENFVFNSGGLLAVHAASASFKQNKRYFNLIGGRFTHHGKIAKFKVDVAKEQSGIYKDISGFFVTDKPYFHEYLEDVTVHFSTEFGSKVEPVVWTREFGKGKVAYCSLGHCAPVLKHPQVASIVHQSLDWLTT